MVARSYGLGLISARLNALGSRWGKKKQLAIMSGFCRISVVSLTEI
jgi:hypothetical protein